MNFEKLFSLAASVVTLAGITVFVTGKKTPQVINAVGNSFANVLRAATGR